MATVSWYVVKCKRCKNPTSNFVGVRLRPRVYLCESCAIADGLLVPCTGEAHSNAFIDHCSVCMPRWGWMRNNKEIVE